MLTGGLRSTFKGMFKTRQAHFGAANIKLLKLRMNAVDNIRKITSAMKMVATAKMKHDVKRLENGVNFGVHVVPTILASDEYMTNKSGDHVAQRILVVPLTSDKGLCGAAHAQIVRDVRDMVIEEPEKYTKIIPVGEKAATGLLRLFPEKIEHAITEVVLPINYYNSSAIANYVMNTKGDHDEILIVYNLFKNSMTQIIQHARLMTKERFISTFKNIVKYEVEEPEPEYANNYFYELYVSSQMFHCILNSAASEQASRMNAMGNASSNAGDILDDLTLQYNRARKAKITMELIEIISGANAL